MRLYRLGDSGTAVRDIQDRLGALGYVCSADPRSEFGETTRTAVISFQRRRGLPADGIVGPETWRAIYEAGFRLGDRLLYLRRPMLRGLQILRYLMRYGRGRSASTYRYRRSSLESRWDHVATARVDGAVAHQGGGVAGPGAANPGSVVAGDSTAPVNG